MGMNPDTKIALTDPKDVKGKAMAEFYVYATENLGWSVKMFTSKKDALL